ncbi:hypothetical protein, variant 1 [Aphanomyces astaci]|uniref:BZIP domain-containing protein n=1 Tax=Aphanomyces astaci TaxID=112090 RepID=W4G035_APHAT|nr:hypothetical protein, variant 1 [Aphanomyces astaci]ETV72419.1 hypothetical protein, variant 1 [Aphanomyces astaci]|eukprot:XP_009838101.1 hypothetical protein, variant 1 [Aphanomyces astaci]
MTDMNNHVDGMDGSTSFSQRLQDGDLATYFLENAGGSTKGPYEDASLRHVSTSLGLAMPKATPIDFSFNHMPSSGTPKNESPAISYNRRGSSVDRGSAASSDGGDGPHSPRFGGDNDFDTEDEKRRKRLERNRISARDSRRRKKQYLELLEEKVAQLTEDIDVARMEHLDTADKTITTVKAQLVTSLYEKLAPFPPNAPLPPDVDDELQQVAQLLKDRYGPNSEERQALIKYHFNQLDGLLLPPYTCFLLWMSLQDDAFYARTAQTPASGKKAGDVSERKEVGGKKDGLWASLSADIAMSYDQEEKIKGHYRANQDSAQTKNERRRIAASLANVQQLQKSMAAQTAAMQTHADSIHAILTPEQVVRYQHWAAQHRDQYGDRLKDQSSNMQQFLDTSAESISDAHAAMLRKPDHEMSVDDVAALLASLGSEDL